MAVTRFMCLLAFPVILIGCSGIRFSNVDDGHSHPYRVASPALKVVTDPDCKMTAEVISIPGRLNWLSFQTGLGKIEDTVEFEPGGTIKKITAKQEGVSDDLVKILNATMGAAKSLGPPGFRENESKGCRASVNIFPIAVDANNNPVVDQRHPLVRVEADRE